MKFLINEYSDLMAVAQYQKVRKERFKIYKIRGWIKIELDEQPVVFQFQRKKSSVLRHGQFTEETTYNLKLVNQKSSHINWADILEAFGNWLDEQA